MNTPSAERGVRFARAGGWREGHVTEFVCKAAKWDKRKLSYEINGLKEGNYILMNFEAAPHVPAELNRLMRISDDVIRHLIISRK
jgi:ribosomal protein S6